MAGGDIPAIIGVTAIPTTHTVATPTSPADTIITGIRTGAVTTIHAAITRILAVKTGIARRVTIIVMIGLVAGDVITVLEMMITGTGTVAAAITAAIVIRPILGRVAGSTTDNPIGKRGRTAPNRVIAPMIPIEAPVSMASDNQARTNVVTASSARINVTVIMSSSAVPVASIRRGEIPVMTFAGPVAGTRGAVTPFPVARVRTEGNSVGGLPRVRAAARRGR
jgi:hypothetical protein